MENYDALMQQNLEIQAHVTDALKKQERARSQLYVFLKGRYEHYRSLFAPLEEALAGTNERVEVLHPEDGEFENHWGAHGLYALPRQDSNYPDFVKITTVQRWGCGDTEDMDAYIPARYLGPDGVACMEHEAEQMRPKLIAAQEKKLKEEKEQRRLYLLRELAINHGVVIGKTRVNSSEAAETTR